MQLFDLLADYLIDNDLYFFRSRIEQAYEAKNYMPESSYSFRVRKGCNDNIFSLLDDSFSYEQARQQSMAVKGSMVSSNSVSMMLKNWRKQGLVILKPDGSYCKITQ